MSAWRMVITPGRLLRVAGSVLSLAALYLLGTTLVEHASILAIIDWNGSTLSVVAFSLGCLLLTQFLSFSIWNIILRGGGEALALRETYAIVGRAQIGKYLPGNVFHYAGRMVLAARYGIAPGVTAATMSIESIVILAGALAVAVSGFIWYSPDMAYIVRAFSTRISSGIVLGVCAAAGAGLFAILFSKAVRHWFDQSRRFLRMRSVLSAAALQAGIFLLLGMAFTVLVKTVWPGGHFPASWFDVAARFAAAWLAGYIIPGAPGGIGVREGAMLYLFSPLWGEGVSAGFAVLTRILTLSSDLLTFLAATSLDRRGREDDRTVLAGQE